MRRFDSKTETVNGREQVAAAARAEILRPTQSQRATLATNFADLLGDDGPFG